MLNLENITLVGIDGLGDSIDTLKAMKYSSKNIKFGRKIFLSANPEKYSSINNNFCEIIKINHLSYLDLNKFVLTEIHKYIDTNFMLNVHPDGFVLNTDNWTNEFLNYDYIGAPWPLFVMTGCCKAHYPFYRKFINNKFVYQVGNGGFSLRSKQLLLKTSELYNQEYDNLPEDVVIGVSMREELESFGLKFPTPQLAAKFSVEEMNIENLILDRQKSFGFHGKNHHYDLLNLLNE